MKDTTNFLNKLSELNSIDLTNVILVTTVVKSLYTSISNDTWLQAIEWALLRTDMDEQLKLFLLEPMHFTHYNSYFQYNSRFYIQLYGTSMGNCAAPSYANIFMSKFEHDYIYNNHLWTTHLVAYWRYIDNSFVACKGSKS